MVAVALDEPDLRETCDDRVLVIFPRVTVKDSAVSDSASSVAVMVMFCVAPAALLAAKVTVPDVADRSACLRSVVSQRRAPGHLHLLGVHRLAQGDREDRVATLAHVAGRAADAQFRLSLSLGSGVWWSCRRPSA